MIVRSASPQSVVTFTTSLRPEGVWARTAQASRLLISVEFSIALLRPRTSLCSAQIYLFQLQHKRENHCHHWGLRSQGSNGWSPGTGKKD